MKPQARSLAQIAQDMRDGKLSATTLLQQSLEQIDALDTELNSFVSVDREGALQQAEALDQALSKRGPKGPLHGVPVAVKANIDVAGAVISACSEPLAARVATQDAACVGRLREAGAVILGITNMHELAYGGTGAVSAHGPARNPQDPNRIAGGSSSGSAVAVASGMVPLALGTDTGGSVRIPAAACGIVGYKPSYNFIDKTGVLPLSWSLDHVGPMTNSVMDAGLSAAALFADTGRGARLMQQLESLGTPKSRLPYRIGVCHVPDMGVEPAVESAVDTALNALKESGATLANFDVQYGRETHVGWLNIMYAEATSRYVKSSFCDYLKFSSPVRVQLEAGKSVSAVLYLDAQRFRGFFQEYFAGVFAEHDVICLPTLPVVAPLLEQQEVTIGGKTVSTQDAMTFTNQLANMLGCPAINIPLKVGEQALPVGLTLLMPYGRDFELLKVAAEFEQVLGATQA